MNDARARTLAQQGEFIRALQELTSTGMTDQSRAAKGRNTRHKILLALQPLDPGPQIIFSVEQVLRAVKTFVKRSTPGPDGQREEYIKVAKKHTTSERQIITLAAVTKLVNVMALCSGTPLPLFEQIVPVRWR